MKIYAVWYNWYNGKDYEDADYDGDVLKIFLNKDAATEFATNLTADELLSFGNVPSVYDERDADMYDSESWIEKVMGASEPTTYCYDLRTREFIEDDKPLVKFYRRHREIDDGKWHYYSPNEKWSISIREWEVEE